MEKTTNELSKFEKDSNIIWLQLLTVVDKALEVSIPSFRDMTNDNQEKITVEICSRFSHLLWDNDFIKEVYRSVNPKMGTKITFTGERVFDVNR